MSHDLVKIPTVFSITVCHMIYNDIHISVHKAPKPMSTIFICGLYASNEQHFWQCNVLWFL